MVASTGIFKKIAFLQETAFGVLPSPTTGGQYLRRQQSTLGTEAQFFKSQEINFDRQLRDNRKGTKMVKGDMTGELSPSTYQQFLMALLGAPATTAAATITLADVTAAATAPGSFTTVAGNFLTAGFKIGDIVRCSGWTTTGAANNARNYRISALTATIMTVGTPTTGATGKPEAVVSKAAGDSVTFAVVGKKAMTPQSGLSDTSFTIENWYSDNGFSEVMLGCKPVSFSLNAPSTAIATGKFSFIGQDMVTGTSQVLAAPNALTTSGLLAGVNGSLMVAGTDFATITALTLNINGNHTTESVVGSMATPGVFPGILDVSGTVTALFADTIFRDAFIQETDYIDLHAKLVTSQALNSDFISFNIPRMKFTSASKSDKSGAITGTYNFQGALNVAGGSGTATDICTISVQDSLFV